MVNSNKFLAPKIIVALDMDDFNKAVSFSNSISPSQCRIKIGKELFTRCGTKIVGHFVNKGFAVFLDLKYHDIPNTVAQACRAAADLGVWMVNVHALGGPRMIEAAASQLQLVPMSTRPLLTAVTILTSHSEHDIQCIGLQGSILDNVKRLALLAKQSGADGIVCSALEAAILRQDCGPEFCLVTPGIRLTSSLKDDQTRIMTPKEAIKAGADYLVIGRPITQAQDPVITLNEIIADL